MLAGGSCVGSNSQRERGEIMNEQELGKEIARCLDIGANETIKQSTLYRLQSARRKALENCQPTTEVINSGNGTSVYGGHDGYSKTGKLLLLVIALFVFTLVSTTHWQFLKKNKSAINTDTTILVDDLPSDTYINNEPELDGDLSMDTYIDDVLQLIDDVSADKRIDSESELADDVTATDAASDDEPERINELPTDTRIDNEFDEWLDSNN